MAPLGDDFRFVNQINAGKINRNRVAGARD